MGWTGERLKVYAVIEGKTLDLVRFSARFPLNDIPKASLTIALGREANSGQASAIHEILDKLKTKRKVEVFLESRSLGKLLGIFDLSDLPDRPVRIFEGYTLGPGYTRTASSAEYTLELEHWLADLGYASAVSALSVPSNPAALTFNAIIANPAEVAGEVAKAGGYTGLTNAEEFLTQENLISDFWGHALQPYFRALTQLETLVDTDAAAKLGLDLDPLPAGNVPARNALDRFEPQMPDAATLAAGTVVSAVAGPIGAALADKKYQFGVPLSFDTASYGGDSEIVAQQIMIAMGSETLEAMVGATIWDKLVLYASTFMFAVSPCIDRVLVIPFTPGLRKEYKTITAGEYDFIHLVGDSPRVLRGVGIYGGRGFEAGADPINGDGQLDYSQFTIGGYFQGAKTGQIKFLQCPMWMTDCTLYSESDDASGAGGLGRGDALNPGAGPVPEDPAPAEKAAANAKLMDKYAESVYVYEILKLHGGDMAGSLRLDIAPGSNLKIEGCGERFLGLSDKFGQSFWATVLQVDLFVDAEGQKAGTSFHLAHVRNELENKTDGFSLDRHPIWTTLWKGAPLLAPS